MITSFSFTGLNILISPAFSVVLMVSFSVNIMLVIVIFGLQERCLTSDTNYHISFMLCGEKNPYTVVFYMSSCLAFDHFHLWDCFVGTSQIILQLLYTMWSRRIPEDYILSGITVTSLVWFFILPGLLLSVCVSCI